MALLLHHAFIHHIRVACRLTLHTMDLHLLLFWAARLAFTKVKPVQASRSRQEKMEIHGMQRQSVNSDPNRYIRQAHRRVDSTLRLYQLLPSYGITSRSDWDLELGTATNLGDGTPTRETRLVSCWSHTVWFLVAQTEWALCRRIRKQWLVSAEEIRASPCIYPVVSHGQKSR